MKFIVFAILFISIHQNSFAAIGCLPGDCCNSHPCGEEPVPTPEPSCRPRSVQFSPIAEVTKRAVKNCHECNENEVCAEYSNNLGEILGHECKMFSK